MHVVFMHHVSMCCVINALMMLLVIMMHVVTLTLTLTGIVKILS